MLSSPLARRRVLLLGSLLLAGALLVWLVVTSPDRRVTLADGRAFAVLGVTYGTQHQFDFGPGWLRPFGKFLPKRVVTRLGMTTAGFSTPKPAMVVWGAWRHDSPTNQAARLGSVIDADGRETEPRHPDLTTFHRTAGLVMAWAFPNFPCRQTAVDFSIHDFGTAFNPVRRAVIAVPNPSRESARKLNSALLPAEVRDGPWTLRLLRLTSSPPTNRVQGNAGDFERTWGTAFFQIQRDGRPDDTWAVESVTCRDAAGHVVEIPPVHRQQMGDEWFWLFSEPIWPANEAIRIEAEFARIREFAADDVFTTPPIALPTNDTPTQVTPAWERHGVVIAPMQLQRVNLGPRGFGDFRVTHHLWLTALPVTRGVRLRLIEVRDDQDRVVPFQTENVARGERHLFSLTVPPGARELRARVALSKSRFAEFVAKPEVAP